MVASGMFACMEKKKESSSANLRSLVYCTLTARGDTKKENNPKDNATDFFYSDSETSFFAVLR